MEIHQHAKRHKRDVMKTSMKMFNGSVIEAKSASFVICFVKADMNSDIPSTRIPLEIKIHINFINIIKFMFRYCQYHSCYIDEPELRSMRQQKVIEGRSLSVTCAVTSANPRPTSSQFTWQQVGGSLTQNQQILRINNIQRSQAGTYRCSATNTMVPTHGQTVIGKGSVTVDLNVLCKWLYNR